MLMSMLVLVLGLAVRVELGLGVSVRVRVSATSNVGGSLLRANAPKPLTKAGSFRKVCGRVSVSG